MVNKFRRLPPSMSVKIWSPITAVFLLSVFLNLIIVFGFQRYTLYGMRYTLYDFVIILFSTNRRQSDIVTVAIFLQLILFCHF